MILDLDNISVTGAFTVISYRDAGGKDALKEALIAELTARDLTYEVGWSGLGCYCAYVKGVVNVEGSGDNEDAALLNAFLNYIETTCNEGA